MTTTFRKAAAADFAAILRLYAQLHPHDEPADSGTFRGVFDRILSTEGLHLCVLDQGGCVVATTYLNLIPNLTRGAAPYAVIENVVVEEGLRGTGLGKQIMAGTLDLAWRHGCYKAMLQTGSRRESTHAYYRACGFSPDEKFAFVAHPKFTFSQEDTDDDVLWDRTVRDGLDID